MTSSLIHSIFIFISLNYEGSFVRVELTSDNRFRSAFVQPLFLATDCVREGRVKRGLPLYWDRRSP
jgi:hypothetical protein